MKHILLYVPSMGVGGVENVVLQLCKGINRKEFKVSLICLYSDMDALISQVPTDVDVYFVGRSTDKKTPSLLLQYVGKLKRIIRKLSPDIIHSHGASGAFLYLAIAVRLSRIHCAVVRTIHFNGFFFLKKTLKDRLRLLADTVATYLSRSAVCAVSDDAAYTVQACYPRKRIHVIENGIDVENTFNPELFKTVPKIPDSVVYVSRLCEGKGHKILLSAWETVVKVVPHSRLFLIGDGLLRGTLEEIVAERELQSSVSFVGQTAEVAKYLSISEIAVFPSESEGFGLSLLEDMAMCLPVVASDIPAFRHIATDGEDVLFYDMYNEEDLAKKILLLLSNEELRLRIGVRARQTAERYTINQMIHNYEALYSEVAE